MSKQPNSSITNFNNTVHNKRVDVLPTKVESKISKITCPLCCQADSVYIIKKYPVAPLLKNYQELFDINARHFFKNQDYFFLYGCACVDYHFFYPFELEGGHDYYRVITGLSKYYTGLKWEHKKAVNYFTRGDYVLEIGCGNGEFIRYLNKGRIRCLGQELNDETAQKMKHSGLPVTARPPEDLIGEYEGKFSAVCMFQVAEHIARINEFITTAIRLLKPGGKLIISVPNDFSFIARDEKNPLNLPPHHMSRWTQTALSDLGKIFPISLKLLSKEPLQKYHVYYYYRIVVLPRLPQFMTKFNPKIQKLLSLPFTVPIFLLSPLIKGHTQLAIYEKNV